MVGLETRLAEERELASWDDFVRSSPNGTLFDTREFLGYHGQRFAGSEEFWVIVKGSRRVAQFAVCIDERDSSHAYSHVGGSFGGVVLAESPTLGLAIAVVDALEDYLQSRGIRSLEVRLPPRVVVPRAGDLLNYEFLRRGAHLLPTDVTSVVLLGTNSPHAPNVQSRCRNSVRRATRNGVSVNKYVTPGRFMPTLSATYERHQTKPTHSSEELEDLWRRLPSDVHFHTAELDGEPVAGACIFRLRPGVLMAFYLAQTEMGMSSHALTYLVYSLIEHYGLEGDEILDLGTSTVGFVPRDGVFLFKETFRAVGYFRESLTWVLGENSLISDGRNGA